MGMTPGEKKAFNKGFEAGADSVEEGLPGWFGTFADMMTLLFAFFVLLAAISTMDPVKLQEMANSEGKSLGSKIKKDGAAEEEGEFEPIENLADMKKEMKEAIEEMKKENPSGDPPLDIQTSSKGLIVNIKGDFAFPSGKADMKPELGDLLDKEIINGELECSAKIRSTQKEMSGKLKIIDKGGHFIFDEPISATSPGQACVFYKNDQVLGGGWIT